MKLSLRVALLLFVVAAGSGCYDTHSEAENPAVTPSEQLPASDQTDPNAPLPTDGEVAPPSGCKALRERGGAC